MKFFFVLYLLLGLGAIIMTSLPFLSFTSLVSVTGYNTEDEPKIAQAFRRARIERISRYNE